MLIQGTSITVMYKRIEDIKKNYYNNKDILSEFFNEATVLPIPDDGPDEIPRIIIKTLHEHAQLNISPIATTFDIRYNDGFENNWKSCAGYICERMKKVFEFLNFLTNNSYEYIGLVSNVVYDDVKQDGAKKLSATLLRSEKIEGIHDINIKYTFVEDENMYVNILLQNARMFKPGTLPSEAGSLGSSEQIAESIGAVVDINDRYGFNNDKNYKSCSGKLQDLIDSMTNVIENKLCTLIEEGAY